eukprot:147356_1
MEDGYSSGDEKQASTPSQLGRPIINNVTLKSDVRSLPLKSVVKIFVTKVPARYASPWHKGHQQKSSGTGFCISGQLIITNSHVIHQHTVVRVRRPGSTTKFLAKVVCEGREVDLALLSVEDPKFWDGLNCLHLETILPELDDNVTTVGYPTGGDGISITRGVVSRICLNAYVVGGQQLVTVQIDAAINPGNSGGPVFNADRKVVGIAQSLITASQNIGFIISVPVIDLFLSEFRSKGTFTGCSSLEITVQCLEGNALREQLGLTAAQEGGVRVRDVSPIGPLYDIVHPNDVIISVFGEKIAADMTVALSRARPDERLPYTHLVSSRPVGARLPIRVLRGGKELELECTLTSATHLVPILHGVDCFPRYFVVGGLVFVPLSRPWVNAAYARKSPSCIITQHLIEFPEKKGQEIVVLSRVLAAEVNFGYQSLKHAIVREFDDSPIHNLGHLAEVVRGSTKKFVTFTLHYKTKITLNRQECIDSEKVILSQHAIDSSALGV